MPLLGFTGQYKEYFLIVHYLIPAYMQIHIFLRFLPPESFRAHLAALAAEYLHISQARPL